jgi:glycosyltransferase involved in cell wall biosynthesis
MNGQVKVSVIIPFFNAAKTLKNCLESLENQDFGEKFEIIMINDCSKDNSLKVIKSTKLKNLKLFSLYKNLGPSGARNYGLDKSRGEYIFFLDADDKILPSTLSILYKKASSQKIDLVFCDKQKIENFHNQRHNLFAYTADKNFSSAEITKEIKKRVSDPVYLPGVIGCHGKLIKKSIIIKNSIRFVDKLRFMEDEIFIIDVLGYSKNVTYIRKQLYTHNIYSNVITARLKAFDYSFPISNFKVMSEHLKQSLKRRKCSNFEIELFGKQSLIFYIIYTLVSFSISIFRIKINLKKNIKARRKILKEIIKDKKIVEASNNYVASQNESSLIPKFIAWKCWIPLEFACNFRAKQIIKKQKGLILR